MAEAKGFKDRLTGTTYNLKDATARAGVATNAETISGLDNKFGSALAPIFSTSTDYTAGQYVWHSGALYRFTTDHAAGSWDAAQVELAVVTNAITTVDDTLSVQGAAADAKKTGDEISDLKSALNAAAYKPTGNLLDFGFIGDTWEQGGIGDQNPYMCRTKKINVTAGDVIYGVVSNTLKEQTAALSGYTMALWGVFFTADDEEIARNNFSNTAAPITTSYTIPSNCAYCIAYLTSGAWGNQFTPAILDSAVAFAYLGYDSVSPADIMPNYVPYPSYNDDNIKSIKSELEHVNDVMYKYTGNMLDFGYLGGTWEQGALNGSVNGYTCVTKLIQANAGETVYGVINAEKFAQSFSYPSICLLVGAYDENGTLIEQHTMVFNTDRGTASYTLPVGTTHIRGSLSTMTWGNDITPQDLDSATAFAYLGMEKISYQDVTANYIPYGEYNENDIGKLESFTKYWNGKTIVWFGTSIPAGVVNAGDSGGDGAYPTRIGDMLGATVYNESVGSSRMRGGSFHHISADDPMGYAGIPMIGLMYSFSLSQAEKQAIMDNWDTKWKDIIPDLASPSNYNSGDSAKYLASSWDAKLTKYLTGGSVGQCDLYVFDHGFNEDVTTYGYSDLGETPDNPIDRTYFIGAMNFAVKKILEDNPKAKILIIGHYNGKGDQFDRGANWDQSYICNAQTAYAELWGFSCVETWKLLGLSVQTITVNGSAKTMIGARYPDNLHPASDATGNELKRYAEALAPYVNMARGT